MRALNSGLASAAERWSRLIRNSSSSPRIPAWKRVLSLGITRKTTSANPPGPASARRVSRMLRLASQDVNRYGPLPTGARSVSARLFARR